MVTPQETVFTCSNGGRMIDFAVISTGLVRDVELTHDLGAPFEPHSSICLKLHLSIGRITLTSQMRPPPMPWEPGGDVKPVAASEIWSGLESTKPVDCREQGAYPVLRASVVFRTFGAVSYFLLPKIQSWLRRLSAYWRLLRNMRSPLDRSTARPPHWLEATRCGRPRFRETSITGRHSWRGAVTSDSLARWWHTVSARLSDCAAVSTSPHTGAQLQNMFKVLKKLQASMPHVTPKELTLGDHPDPDLEVSSHPAA